MNYMAASRNGSHFLPLRVDPKSPPSEGYAFTYLNSKRGAAAAPTKRNIPSTTSRTSSTTTGSSKMANSLNSIPNKWFQDPKIPIRLNSSTLIRMKSKNPSNNQGIGDNRANNQLMVAALSFLKRDRRMSDFEVAKGISPFGDTSYVKNVFLNIAVSHCNSPAMVQASVNLFGDGVHTNATYHRISAFSLDDCKTGCNLKFVEHVSYEGTAPPPQTAVEMESVGQSTAVSASKNRSGSFSVSNLNAMLKQTTLSEPKKLQNGCDGASDVDGTNEDEESVKIRPQVMKKKKKLNQKHK